MAVLTKAELLAQVAALWPNNDNEEISENGSQDCRDEYR